MTHGGWKAPSILTTRHLRQHQKNGVAKTVANVPPVFSGMDKEEALAYVSRLFDAAQAGAVLWGDKLLLKRFLEQCSRTGSKETQDLSLIHI